jgi:hypothetical protein
MAQKAICLLAALALTAGAAVCQSQSDKDANEAHIRVNSFNLDVQANSGATTAATLGLPTYPGAQIAISKDNDNSADLHLAFGKWEFRLRAVHYSTSDSKDQVAAFYKKALKHYGEVLVCQGEVAVGELTVTTGGLSCKDDGKDTQAQGLHGSIGVGGTDLELKAGSKHHQYIFGFEESKDGKTQFVLLELVLPTDSDGDKGKN